MSAADVAWQGDTDSAQTRGTRPPLQGLGKKATQISLLASLSQKEEDQYPGREPVGMSQMPFSVLDPSFSSFAS